MFQPQAAPVQPAVQQVTSQPTQVTNAQMVAAQVTSAPATVSQSNISVAALQTAGLSINPAIVRALLPRFLCSSSCESHDLIPSHIYDVLPRSMPLPWELSPSFSVPSPPLPSSPVPCPTWLASPVRSSQTPRDRYACCLWFFCFHVDVKHIATGAQRRKI